MSKHTPGPWRWWACRETESASNDYIQIAAGLNHVAQIKITSITEHDMRLIAASPSLLAALIGCVDHMEHSTPQGKQAYETAKAEIAKATGETQ